MALNSDDPRALRRSTHTIDEAYGAQHSRSTRGMMFQDPMPTGGAGRSSLPRNVIIYNFPGAAIYKFPGCSAAETPYKVQQQWTITSHLLTNPGSPTEPHPRLRNGHPDVQDGLPSSSRRRRRGDGRWESGERMKCKRDRR